MSMDEARTNEYVKFITEQPVRNVAQMVKDAKAQCTKKYKWNITQSAFAQQSVDALVKMYAKA